MDSSRTEELDVNLFNLSLTQYLSSLVHAGVSIPLGDLRVKPLGAEAERLSGFGDVTLSLGADISTLWAPGRFRPALTVVGGLLLPTGESRPAGAATGAPPNRVALGNGAFGTAIDLRADQPIAKRWSIRGALGFRTPFHPNENALFFGSSLSAGLGVATRIAAKVMLSLDGSFQRLGQTHEVHEGAAQEDISILNSGGRWDYLQAQAHYAPVKDYVVGINAQVPVYNDPNGEQIVQSWSAGFTLTHIFGYSEHDHDDHDGHGSHDGHDDKEASTHEGSAEHAAHDMAIAQVAPSQVAQALAVGGESFQLADAHVPGKWVLIDFWAEWCAPCHDMTAYLTNQAANQSDLEVRTVEVPTFDSPVAREHLSTVSGLPVVWLIDPEGNLHKTFESAEIPQIEDALDGLASDNE